MNTPKPQPNAARVYVVTASSVYASETYARVFATYAGALAAFERDRLELLETWPDCDPNTDTLNGAGLCRVNTHTPGHALHEFTVGEELDTLRMHTQPLEP